MTEPTPEPTPEAPPEPTLVDTVIANAVEAQAFWTTQRDEGIRMRDAAVAEFQKLQDVIALAKQFQRLFEERQALLDQARTRIDNLIATRDSLIANRDTLIAQRDAIIVERDALKLITNKIYTHAANRKDQGLAVNPDVLFTILERPYVDPTPDPAPAPAP